VIVADLPDPAIDELDHLDAEGLDHAAAPGGSVKE